jgi:hypothetical protein
MPVIAMLFSLKSPVSTTYKDMPDVSVSINTAHTNPVDDINYCALLGLEPVEVRYIIRLIKGELINPYETAVSCRAAINMNLDGLEAKLQKNQYLGMLNEFDERFKKLFVLLDMFYAGEKQDIALLDVNAKKLIDEAKKGNETERNSAIDTYLQDCQKIQIPIKHYLTKAKM